MTTASLLKKSPIWVKTSSKPSDTANTTSGVNHSGSQTASTLSARLRVALVLSCWMLSKSTFPRYLCVSSLATAGFVSGISREGFFKLEAHGPGTIWFGAYGGLVGKEIDGEYIVDTSHLVAYEPQLKLKLQMAGGIFSSFFSGEGLVTRVEGNGKIWIQTRSIGGLAGWLNPKI